MPQSIPPPYRLITQEQACALTGLTRRTLSNRVKAGLIHSYVDPFDHRRTLYDRDELLNLEPRPRKASTTK